MGFKEDFSYSKLQFILQSYLSEGYEFSTYKGHIDNNTLINKRILLRIDVDLSIKKLDRLLTILRNLNILATIFVRLHAKEYNPFDFENYRILKIAVEDGHEIGLHTELVDQSIIWSEDPAECLKRDIRVINDVLGVKICGTASHGGLTGLNNLHFWENYKPEDFDLLYEAYEKEGKLQLFNNSFYISDSEWIRWKCYSKGELVLGDHRDPIAHLTSNHSLVNLLIHPDTYYDRHIYE